MRILSARNFSKSFGGKIKNFQTDVNKKFFLNWRMRILSARIFFRSLLAGKLKLFKPKVMKKTAKKNWYKTN